MASEKVVEIAVEGAYLALDDGFVPAVKGQGVLKVADVLHQVAEARAGGANVLLLSVDSLGGQAAAGLLLYDALRSFSEDCGLVVAYVARVAASTATDFVLAADYIVMNPQSLFSVHSPSVTGPVTAEEAAELVEGGVRMSSAVLRAHTLAPAADVDCWLRNRKPEGEILLPKRARELGFVDFIGPKELAVELAGCLAAGAEVASARQTALASREEHQELLGNLWETRTAGRLLASLCQALGEEGYNTILNHLKDTVNDVMMPPMPNEADGVALRLIRYGRRQVTDVVFGLNVAQTFQNFADVVGVKAVVPPKYAMKASLKLTKDLAERAVHGDLDVHGGEVAQILKRSAEMRIRVDGYRNSVQAGLQDAFRTSGIELKWEHVKDLMMVPFETSNAMVEFPVWLGSYDHATTPRERGGLGLAEAEAVRHADTAVRTLLGGKRSVDLSPIQRGQITRHFTMFYGWANAQLNLFIKAAGEAGVQWREGARFKALKTIGTSFALLWAKNMASELLSGRAPEDKDKDGVDAEDLGWWAAYRGVMVLPMTMPLMSSVVRSAESNRDVSLTPWLSSLNSIARTLQVTDKVVDAGLSQDKVLTDEQLTGLFMAWLDLGGQLAGAPTVQLGQTSRYWQRSTGNESVAEDVLGTMFGPKRKGKLSGALFGE